MVKLTITLLKMRRYLKSGFKDSLRIFAAAGSGGNGLPKFGGVGGKGGDVIVQAKEGVTLQTVFNKNKSKTYNGKPGKSATHNFILGPPGENVVFDVPVGVTLYTDFGKKIGELNEDGEQLVLAKGGKGGNSKNGFLGTRGQLLHIILDLKLIADVGLVGFPNAGKSTLLRAISDAKPKVASYPFTTVRPHLGIVNYSDLRQISVADLPGLIEGAYANKGMGHQFLKHVERTKLILMIVDINGFQLSPQYPHRSCLETIMLLTKELELYNEELLNKPSLLLINKMDTENAKEKYEKVKLELARFQEFLLKYDENIRPERTLKFYDILPISAKTNEDNLNLVRDKLRSMLDLISEESVDEQLTEKQDKLHKNLEKIFVEKGPALV